MVARVKDLFAGRIRNWTCPKAHSMYRPTEAISRLSPNRPSLMFMLFVPFDDCDIGRLTQGCEGVYWYPASLPDEDERSFKVRAAKDIQAPPQQYIKDYLSESTVG
jgi:hypothetical protein